MKMGGLGQIIRMSPGSDFCPMLSLGNSEIFFTPVSNKTFPRASGNRRQMLTVLEAVESIVLWVSMKVEYI